MYQVYHSEGNSNGGGNWLPILGFLLFENKAQMLLFSRFTPLVVALVLLHAALFAYTALRKRGGRAASEEAEYAD